LKLLESLWT